MLRNLLKSNVNGETTGWQTSKLISGWPVKHCGISIMSCSFQIMQMEQSATQSRKYIEKWSQLKLKDNRHPKQVYQGATVWTQFFVMNQQFTWWDGKTIYDFCPSLQPIHTTAAFGFSAELNLLCQNISYIERMERGILIPLFGGLGNHTR